METLTTLPEWAALKTHAQALANTSLRHLFATHPDRASRFSLHAATLMLDYSKNRVTDETIHRLCQLAMCRQLPEKIIDLFQGKLVNISERQAALHTALRDSNHTSLWVDGEDILIEIRKNIEKMSHYVEKIQQKQVLGYSGLPITDVVNIGIGGSDLGPALACEALLAFKTNLIHTHFVSNADSTYLLNLLNHLNPATTLFIISSKSFRSKETLLNAKTARDWLIKAKGDEHAIMKQFFAVTAKPTLAIAFGVPSEHIFTLSAFIGGRYSVWSAMGLPIALSIGMDAFKDFLAGAEAMDQHFFSAPLDQNMPVILGLLGVWYINFFDATAQVILPYCEALKKLPVYLQQLDMESNGKSVTQMGIPIDYKTGGVLFGEVGTNSQHAFHQLLHQGTRLIPADFILIKTDPGAIPYHHDLLVASGLSQSRALMLGKTYEEAYDQLIDQGYLPTQAAELAPHQVLPGNRPSNTLILPQLNPYTLGALIALYEHKVFVQSVIWDINCFDQWGIELGKQVTDEILSLLANPSDFSTLDSSTEQLLNYTYLK